MAEQTFTFSLSRKSGNKGLNKGNQIISTNDRMHPIVKAKITSYLRSLSFDTVIHQGMIETFNPEYPCEVIMIVYPPTKRRMDPHNLAITLKALIDGMTDAGLFTDDDYHVVDMVAFRHGGKTSGDKNYRIDIIVKSIE